MNENQNENKNQNVNWKDMLIENKKGQVGFVGDKNKRYEHYADAA